MRKALKKSAQVKGVHPYLKRILLRVLLALHEAHYKYEHGTDVQLPGKADVDKSPEDPLDWSWGVPRLVFKDLVYEHEEPNHWIDNHEHCSGVLHCFHKFSVG